MLATRQTGAEASDGILSHSPFVVRFTLAASGAVIEITLRNDTGWVSQVPAMHTDTSHKHGLMGIDIT